MPPLYETCPACKGEGGWRAADGDWGNCPQCDGEKKVVSTYGRELLEFVTKNIEFLRNL